MKYDIVEIRLDIIRNVKKEGVDVLRKIRQQYYGFKSPSICLDDLVTKKNCCNRNAKVDFTHPILLFFLIHCDLGTIRARTT